MIKLVIFDLDGTLLNTLDDLADSSNYVLQQHGFPTHPTDAYRYFVGNGIPVLIQRVLPPEYKEGPIYEQCLQEFIAYYSIHMADKTKPYSEITETLTQLQHTGVKIAVATNKVHHAVAPLMKDYFPTIRFDALCGQQPSVKTKPDPQIVFHILKETGYTQEETLYAGDTAVDMNTAHNAGLHAVGVLWGYRPQKELEDAGADWLIRKPSELLPLIEQLNNL